MAKGTFPRRVAIVRRSQFYAGLVKVEKVTVLRVQRLSISRRRIVFYERVEAGPRFMSFLRGNEMPMA